MCIFLRTVDTICGLIRIFVSVSIPMIDSMLSIAESSFSSRAIYAKKWKREQRCLWYIRCRATLIPIESERYLRSYNREAQDIFCTFEARRTSIRQEQLVSPAIA